MPKVADLHAELGLKKDKYDKGMKDAEAGPSKLGKAFNVAGVAIAASVTLIAAGLMSISKQSIAAWDAQEKANQGLLVALKGRVDMQTVLLGQASKLQNTTLFEDDAIVQAQKMLAVMGLSVVQINDLIPKLQDFSTITKIDLVQAAEMAGKAISGGANRLRGYGVELDDTMSKTEKANAIMAVFTERFGGQAESAAKAGASGLQQLNKAWGEIQETIGSKIGPFMAALSTLISGKLLDATSGAAATGMQKTINDYVNADEIGRKKIQEGLKSSLAEYNRQWKEYKGKQMQAEASHAAGQADIVREALEKIADLNKENNVKIVGDVKKTTEAIKELWTDVITVAQYQYSVGSALTPKGMPQVTPMGLASDTSNMGPEFFDYDKFISDLDKATEAFTNFKNDMASMVKDFISDSIVTLFEALGQAAAGADMQNAFDNVLGMFASFLGQLGKMMIAYGVSALAFSILSKAPNPGTAIALIAAGGAMVAIGSAISSSMEAASAGNMTGGSMGGSDYATPYTGGYSSGGDKLVAQVSGNDLLFIWERANKNKYRIGKG